MTRLLIASVTALFVAAPLSLAQADDADQARSLFRRGQKHYRAGDYHQAAGYFMRAHTLHPAPAILFNAAQAYRKAHVCEVAARLYREFLAGSPDHRDRDVVESHAAAMDACAERQSQSRATSVDRALLASSPVQSRRSQTAGWLLTGAGAALVTTAGFVASDDGPEQLTFVAGGLGLGALITGSWLLLRDHNERGPVSAPRLSTTAGGAVAGWSWGF